MNGESGSQPTRIKRDGTRFWTADACCRMKALTKRNMERIEWSYRRRWNITNSHVTITLSPSFTEIRLEKLWKSHCYFLIPPLLSDQATILPRTSGFLWCFYFIFWSAEAWSWDIPKYHRVRLEMGLLLLPKRLVRSEAHAAWTKSWDSCARIPVDNESFASVSNHSDHLYMCIYI